MATIVQSKPEPNNLLKFTQINNRRYLGNKYKLLPFIKSVVESECGGIDAVADIFAGTGAVSSAFTNKRLVTNDNLYSNYICHVAWFSPEGYSRKKIIRLISRYNEAAINKDNYMSVNFTNTFFSRADCRKIGHIREDIEELYRAGDINYRERALLITSLLYAADKIAKTCGHYDAYRQNVKFDKEVELLIPLPNEPLNSGNACYNMDANKLVRTVKADLVYIDPPYNSRQYCDAYHLLENIAKWEKPKVAGVARKMDRSLLKSDYCTSRATEAFQDLIDNIEAKYILLSYNNMAQKGNTRSNAKIDDDSIFEILSKKGEVKIFSENHKAFTAGKSNYMENAERLFLCICRREKVIIQSPLNYIGGKYKLLPQIIPHFPKNIDIFADLFCGGCNVGVNIDCDRTLFNDNNPYLINLYNTLKIIKKETALEIISGIIDKYNLSKSSVNGYGFYNCDGSKGLSGYNKDKYLKLRKDFNQITNKDYYYYIMLYVLVIYSFNNQIRFNNKGGFNLPVGKRDFNLKMQAKLSAFIDRLKKESFSFSCHDFREFDISKLTENSLVYADPPYLITCASYNEKDGWNESHEIDLLKFLDELHNKNIRFALSNVISSKARQNEILIEWLNKNKGVYRVIHLDYTYSNSNYHTKDKETVTDEVLIINY